MFTSIIKELLVTKIAECNMKYIEILSMLIDDEYENSNIVSHLRNRKHLWQCCFS